MLTKEYLRKLGILGVSFGLIVSPLAFGDMHEEPVDPAAQGTGSAADSPTQPADPTAGEPNTQGDPTQNPGFGEGTEAMPGAEGPAASDEETYEYESAEEKAPWDEEGDDSEDEERGW
ncbi:MAG: hypothetical protein ACQEXG_13315 [Pseudomonadota bacterium]